MRSVLISLILFFAACSSNPLPPTTSHLMVKATHQDLGHWIKGTVAYNKQLGGTVDYSVVPSVYFDTGATDCTLAFSVIELSAYDPDQDFYVSGRGYVMAPSYRYKLLQADDSFAYTAVLDPGLELPLCNMTPRRTVAGFYYHFVTDGLGYLAKLQTFRPDELTVEEISDP